MIKKYRVTHDRIVPYKMEDTLSDAFGADNAEYRNTMYGDNWVKIVSDEHFIVHASNASEITQFHLKHPGYKFEELT